VCVPVLEGAVPWFADGCGPWGWGWWRPGLHAGARAGAGHGVPSGGAAVDPRSGVCQSCAFFFLSPPYPPCPTIVSKMQFTYCSPSKRTSSGSSPTACPCPRPHPRPPARAGSEPGPQPVWRRRTLHPTHRRRRRSLPPARISTTCSWGLRRPQLRLRLLEGPKHTR
jgi:hypothetical protein